VRKTHGNNGYCREKEENEEQCKVWQQKQISAKRIGLFAFNHISFPNLSPAGKRLPAGDFFIV
jgi:hypothetical protein